MSGGNAKEGRTFLYPRGMQARVDVIVKLTDAIMTASDKAREGIEGDVNAEEILFASLSSAMDVIVGAPDLAYRAYLAQFVLRFLVANCEVDWRDIIAARQAYDLSLAGLEPGGSA